MEELEHVITLDFDYDELEEKYIEAGGTLEEFLDELENIYDDDELKAFCDSYGVSYIAKDDE